MGIGTMSRGEKAMIYVTSQYLNQCTFMPRVEEGIEEVHFEVELLHFIQVWRILWCSDLHYQWCQFRFYIFWIVVIQHIVLMSLDYSFKWHVKSVDKYIFIMYNFTMRICPKEFTSQTHLRWPHVALSLEWYITYQDIWFKWIIFWSFVIL